MPELFSVHGRCPRCSQVLTVPAGQLESVFRCARCQYRVPGSVLIDEAKSSPPRAPATPVLGPFDEDPDDQNTRMHLPGAGADEESEIPLAAVLVVPSSAPPAPLQRFDMVSDDADDQQTRLHVAGSFDAKPVPPPVAPAMPPAPPQRAPMPPAPPQRVSMPPAPPQRVSMPPAPPRVSMPPAPPQRAPMRDGTLLGMPAAPSLSRFDRVAEDADDQATRLHLVDEQSSSGRTSLPANPQTLLGVPAARGDQPAPALQRFDQVGDDPEDQNTRLQVPISYEADEAPAPVPQLRPLVAARASTVDALRFDPAPFTGSSGLGRMTLQLSRSIDDWVRERHLALLLTLAVLNAIIAPAFDALLGGARHGATVIAANVTLFFLWALAFAWLGRLRNDAGVWDYRVGWTRFATGVRLALQDLASFGALPGPLRWRVIGEGAGAIGLLGLGLASALTVSHLVWGWPATAPLLIWRAFSGTMVVLSLVALRETSGGPLGFAPATEVTAPAVAHFPAVIDLSLPLSMPAAHGNTPLHHVLDVLSQWEPREWPNLDSYLAVLERHLLRHMGSARIERERWLGETRADGIAHIIVEDSLLIEVMHGFDASAAERVAAKLRLYAKSWRGKPAIIVIFDGSRSALLEGPGRPPLEALHQSYPMLTVRMPSARTSLM